MGICEDGRDSQQLTAMVSRLETRTNLLESKNRHQDDADVHKVHLGQHLRTPSQKPISRTVEPALVIWLEPTLSVVDHRCAVSESGSRMTLKWSRAVELYPSSKELD